MWWRLVLHDETVMARGKIRYFGEPVAAVAAVDVETAERALDLIELEVEELPAFLLLSKASILKPPWSMKNSKNTLPEYP